MTITKNDIKLLASERLTDDADGGGLMTGSVIQDGVENNLFPDILEVDRAQGAVDFRKVYAAVLSAGTEAFYGAHVILDQLAQDPAVTSVLTAAASAGELRSGLITALNAAGQTAVFYGTKPIAAAAGLGTRTVRVASLYERLIPPSTLGGLASGPVQTREDTKRIGRPAVYAPSTTIDASVTVDQGSFFYTHPRLGQFGGSAIYLNAAEGFEYLGVTPNELAVEFTGSGFYPGARTVLGVPQGLYVGSYAPTFEVPFAVVTENFTFTSGGTTRFYNLADLPAEASETITWTGIDSQVYTLTNRGPEDFVATAYGTARVDRTTSLVVVEFLVPPTLGGTVAIRYGKRSDAAAVAAPADSAPDADGARQLVITGGMGLVEAQFTLDGERCRVRATDNTVRKLVIDTTESLPKLKETSVVGAYDPATAKLYLAGPGSFGNWMAVQAKPVASTATGTVAHAGLQPNLEPATLVIAGTKADNSTFTAACAADGTFSGFATGTYSAASGELALSFSTAVKLASLSFTASKLVSTVVGSDVAGIDPAQFRPDGLVRIFRQSDLVVVHNTADMAPATVANGQTVDTTRPRLSDLRVFGSNGGEITAGFTTDLAAGTVTFASVAGYSQPVTIRSRVEDVASANVVDVGSGSLSLSRGLSRDYPADGRTFVSSALLLGDLQARSHLGFQQSAWLGDFDDSPVGGTIVADYNEAAHPIEANDKGTITERWALIFTSTSTFRLIGENVGEIATGSTGVDFAPNNPATSAPYFVLRAAGWGGGWATGNVYRFNTTGGSAPLWALRSIAPSDPYPSQDHVTVAVRGSIDA